ncbi:MAG: Ig-like domain-containing protein [Gammaproteobacteria bacterium]
MPPAVSQIDPADGAAGFPVNGVIVVRFTERLQPASVVPGTVRLFQGATEIPGRVTLSDDGLSITFDPIPTELVQLTLHSVRVVGVRDIAGNRMDERFESSFTTAEFVDTTPPTVVRTSPFNGQAGVPVNAPFTVEFSERMDPATLSPDNFTVSDNVTGQNVAGMVQVDPDGRTASFVPERPYAVGRGHSVFLDNDIKDAAGNRLGFHSFFFTTEFATDNERPRLMATSPTNGDTGVSVNALIVLDFNEPLHTVNVFRGIQISANGEPVAGSFALSEGNRRVTFTSEAALKANTNHTVRLTTTITDLVGNPLDNPGSITFQTSSTGDITPPQVLSVDPANGATGVPVNTVVRVRFSERINPLTVDASTFFVGNSNTGARVEGSLAVAADGLSAIFTPASALAGSTPYFVQVFSVTDLAGNAVSFFFASFTTGAGGSDTTAPVVVAVSPPDGATGAPVNARVVVRLNEPVSALSVGSGAVSLTTAGGPLAGAISLSNDRQTLTFTPTSPLAVSTAHTVQVSGFTDVAGNAVVPFTSGFTTGASATADTIRPSVSTVSPANNATGVPVTSAIVVTFNEAIDPSTVNSNTLPITIDGFSGVVAGNYSVNGAVVTFTPLNPLPGNVRVRTSVNAVQDLAGNNNNFFQSSFVTAAVADVTPPAVVMVTPAEGAVEMGQSVPVVLTFSESLNANTISSNTFALFANGDRLFPSITRSADNRTVTLTGFLPASSTIAVVVTDGVQDLSGNRLSDFRSTFTTAASFDTGQPFVVNQRPGNGASGVKLDRGVVLYVSEPLDAATVPGALHVSQNGVLVGGTTTVPGDGRTVRFVPSSPWAPDALIQVFLDGTARDRSGNAFSSYQGSFRTLADTSTTPPFVVRTNLDSGVGLPRNGVIEIEFNEPLDPATVDAGVVTLQENSTGSVLSTAVSLVRAGRVIRIVPASVLAAEEFYILSLSTAVRDLDGEALPFGFFRFFQTGADTDAVRPLVVAVSPPAGAVGVGINAGIRVRFDEPINPLTVTEESIRVGDGTAACTISFTNNNRDVLIEPHAPFPVNTLLNLTVDGVEDLAGHAVLVQTTQFTTGNGPDTTAPQVVRTVPSNGDAGVPVNTVIEIELDESIDPVSVDANTFQVSDNFVGVVAGTRSVSSDGRVLRFVSDAPLSVGRGHNVFASIRDLAGNTGFSSFFFTTGFATDTEPPEVVGVSPADGLTGVPTNVRVVAELSEPIQSRSIDEVKLSAGGAEVAVKRLLSNGNRTLTLIPLVPLAGSTAHTVDIGPDVKDLAGNALGAPVSSTFTTATGADLTSPQVTSVDPANGATGVPVNTVVRVQFNERINPLTVTRSTFLLRPTSTFVPVEGSITVAADGLSATFTPATALSGSTQYRVDVFSVTDLAGNTIFGFASSFTTGTP